MTGSRVQTVERCRASQQMSRDGARRSGVPRGPYAPASALTACLVGALLCLSQGSAFAQDRVLQSPAGAPYAVPLPPTPPAARADLAPTLAPTLPPGESAAEVAAAPAPQDPVADAPVAPPPAVEDQPEPPAVAAPEGVPPTEAPEAPLAELPAGPPPAAARPLTPAPPVEVEVDPPEDLAVPPPSPLGTTLDIDPDRFDGTGTPGEMPPPIGSDLASLPPDAARIETPPGETVIALPGAEGLRILYAAESDAVDEGVREAVVRLAGDVAAAPARLVEIRAFASGSADLAAHARRLSLDRALGIRGYLLDHGVPSTRIDVRALGNTASDGPADRVDIIVR